ncbi:MAG: hypothetical protein WBF66_07320 [Dehalococcoidia bacterium]
MNAWALLYDNSVLVMSAWDVTNSPFITVLASVVLGGLVVGSVVRLREEWAAAKRDGFETKRLLQLEISRAVHEYLGAAFAYSHLREESPRYEGVKNRIRWALRHPAAVRPGLMRRREEAAAVAWGKAFGDWCVRRQEIAVHLRLRFAGTRLPDEWERLADDVSYVPAFWHEAIKAGRPPELQEYYGDLSRATGQATSFLGNVLREPLSSPAVKGSRVFLLKVRLGSGGAGCSDATLG